MIHPLSLFQLIKKWGAVALGLVLALAFVTLPMEAEGQAWLTLAGIAVFLVLNRYASRKVGMVLVFVSIMVTSRYLYWRLTETLEFETALQTFLGGGLFVAELYAGILMALSYIQTSWPLNRKPVPLPADPALWPTVDVYVPTYNESLDLVRPTVLAAMNMDYPRDKMNVWILDDGRRPEFRQFAQEAGCGYIIRPDNKGAKAGNLNHAMEHTNGEFIAIFDCDHAPTRAFLQFTLGWFLRDRRIGIVQTPHHFYSPDPFERNLARKRPVPNEGLLFYGTIQQGNDLWNAAFFCGSCAVLRRTALEQVGGVPHTTVTEDCHCALKMQQLGWHTAYLRVPLAAGLATERLALHIGQRMRWARGMIQIMRLENTLFAKNLKWMQRFCYFIAGFGFLFALPRLIFLTSPLAFLFFGESVIAASPLAIMAYAGSHLFHAVATTARLNGRHRHSFWSEIYEASLAVPLVPVTLLTLWDPRKGKFNVTDKGGVLEAGYLDFKAVAPNLVLLVLVFAGFCIGVYGTIVSDTNSLDFRAYLLNTIWAGMCLIPLGASVAVGREREQMRIRHRVDTEIPATIIRADGRVVKGACDNLSLSGMSMALTAAAGLEDDEKLEVALEVTGEVIPLKAHVVRTVEHMLYLEFELDGVADEAAVARAFFGRPDAWLHWDDWPEDRPLRSLANVVLATADAAVRRYRFGIVTKAPRPAAVTAAAPQAPVRVTDVVQPRRAGQIAAALALALLAAPAAAQVPAPAAGPVVVPADPGAVPPALAVPAPPRAANAPETLPEGARIVTRTLRELGLSGPMQLRGIADLQGVLFGLRADEVVTDARLTVNGGVSARLIPDRSQIAISLNEQFVGNIPVEPARQGFGPLEFPLDPLFFAEVNRLNFRFSGQYTAECNDPLSGLLYATVSDLSTVRMRIERIPPTRDLARLPEPLFDRRVLRGSLTLPVVIPESTGPAGLRAAGIAASWFAVQADYRGARFPVERVIPPRGDAVVLAAGADTVPGVTLPRFEGPTLALVAHPQDQFGTLLVIGGRTEAEVATAALALVASRQALAGEVARVAAPQLAARQPYDAPRWLRTDQPIRIGAVVPREELTAHGYQPGPLRLPLRTAPDLYTWRGRGFPARIGFIAPQGPVIDVATSRLDAAVSGTYLRSFTLAEPPGVMSWVMDTLHTQLGLGSEMRRGRFAIPPYLLLGQDELQLRFDMRPMNRGECAAVPGDIQASIDPESTIDLTGAHRFARMPNLGYFASSGFPFTRMADLSGTAVVLPERPNVVETQAYLDMVGWLSAITGLPATGVQVAPPTGLRSLGDRDLLVIGTLSRQPTLGTLLRDSPVRQDGDRITLALPDTMQHLRNVLWDAPSAADRSRAAAAVNEAGGEGMGVLLGAQSALASGRSVVVVSGATPAAIGGVVSALRDPTLLPSIRGDTVLLAGGRAEAYTVADPYWVGRLPWYLWAQHWAGQNPLRALIILFLGGALIGIPAYWSLRRRALSRLRARDQA
ncbi:UDP-forming cellulose synthase catalytic subunit [Rhodovarius crocodyli]|uniref:Cellulose synthase catalytic subunit [UDP-forming] n=1 Tax=Rhodovarius crocodyli TaxID=1979269 RepID=A0A437MMJ5_9PROT|nr:UDP-forming cellulose synthase catalytic subunit [Rhodovarius crocodyli]RVT98878.1 UDP-forming cellulose synthase catalytic subunit [Rhodovarius crocodyli]